MRSRSCPALPDGISLCTWPSTLFVHEVFSNCHSYADLMKDRVVIEPPPSDVIRTRIVRSSENRTVTTRVRCSRT